MIALRSIAVVALAAMLRAAAAQAPNPLPPAGVASRRLPNGATVLVRRDPGAALCVVDLWIGAGSADDGGSAAAHALEHMVFKGSAPPIDATLETLGCVAYAATLADATHYWTSAPADAVPAAAAALAGVLRPPAVAAGAWEIERRVMLDEQQRSTGDAAAEARRALARALFGPVYAAPAAGTPAALNALTPDAIEAFHRTWYRPDRAVMVIVGNVDPGSASDAAENALSGIPASRAPAPARAAPTAGSEGPVEASASAGQEAAAGMAWPTAGADPAAVDVLCEVLRPRLASRLAGQARRISVAHPWQRADLLAIVAVGEQGDAARLASALKAAVRDAARGITDGEVEAAVRRGQLAWWLAHESPASQATALGLAGTRGDLREATLQPARLGLVTADGVRDAARRLAGPEP